MICEPPATGGPGGVSKYMSEGGMIPVAFAMSGLPVSAGGGQGPSRKVDD